GEAAVGREVGRVQGEGKRPPLGVGDDRDHDPAVLVAGGVDAVGRLHRVAVGLGGAHAAVHDAVEQVLAEHAGDRMPLGEVDVLTFAGAPVVAEGGEDGQEAVDAVDRVGDGDAHALGRPVQVALEAVHAGEAGQV